MKNIFKLSVVAAALAVSGAASAASITSNTYLLSQEALQVEGSAQSAAAIPFYVSYTLGADYVVGDLIEITHSDFQAGTSTSFPSQIELVDPKGTGGDITFNRISNTTTSTLYRVSNKTGTWDTSGLVVSFGDTTVPAPLGKSNLLASPAKVLANGGVSVSFESRTQNGTVFDQGLRQSTNALAVVSQVGSNLLSPFNSVIDVSTLRTLFTGSSLSSSASITANINSVAQVAAALAPASGTNFNVAHPTYPQREVADFTLRTAITADVADLGIAVNGSALSATARAAAYEEGVLTTDFTNSSTANSGSIGGSVTFFNASAAANRVTLRPQEFTIDADLRYGTDLVRSLRSNAPFGAWTLNGANAVVPYLPYGQGISRIVYVSNSSSQAGDVSVTAIDEEGNSYDLGIVASAAAGSTTRLTAAIDSALFAAGFTTGRVSLDITVNAPTARVEFFAAYNVSGDRLSVEPVRKN